jgi:hypothetical protein
MELERLGTVQYKCMHLHLPSALTVRVIGPIYYYGFVYLVLVACCFSTIIHKREPKKKKHQDSDTLLMLNVSTGLL